MNIKTSNFLKYSILTGLSFLFLVPFIISTDLFFPFVTGKAYFFRIVLEVIFFLWVILAVVEPKYRPKKSLILFSFVLFLFSILISNILGVNKMASFWSNYERMDGYVTQIHLLMLFLVAGSVLKTVDEWKKYFDVSIVINLFFIFASIQKVFFAGNPEGYRLDLFLGNAAYVGVYFLLYFFITLFNFVSTKNRGLKIFYSLMMILQVFFIFQTGTRGSMLGLLAGLLVTAFLVFVLNRNDKNIYWKISGIFLGSIFILIGLFFAFKDSSIIQNNYPLKRLADISYKDQSTSNRLLTWKMAIEGVKERPLLGWGQSNFNYVFDKYYLPQMHGAENFYDRVHNFILDWAIAGGILGLLLFVSIFVFAIFSIMLSQKLSRTQKSILIGVIFAYLINNFFVFDQVVSYIFITLILAFAHSQNNKDCSLMEAEIKEQNIKMISVACLILIPITIYYVNIPSYVSNRNLIEAIQIFKKENNGYVFAQKEGIGGNLALFEMAIKDNNLGGPEIRERFLESANEIKKFKLPPELKSVQNNFENKALYYVQELTTKIDPLNSRYHYFLAIHYANSGMINNAIDSIKKAMEISKNKQIYRNILVEILLTTNKQEALALAKETYELEKSKDDVWFNYFKALLVNEKDPFLEIPQEEFTESRLKFVEQYYTGTISKDPKNITSRISLAAFYFQIGEKEKAIDSLKKTLVDFPNMSYQINSVIKKIENGENPLGSKIILKK